MAQLLSKDTKDIAVVKSDIIIVGSGPAGISTALNLARIAPELARRTVVLECKQHPRPKLCAGGVLKDGEYILESLGLDCSRIPHVEVKEAHFLFEGKGICIKRFPESFMVVRREDFDNWLVTEAKKLGIRVVENTRVFNIIPSEKSVKLETDQGDYVSLMVVGADGANSVVRRSVINGRPPSQSIALEVFINHEKYKKLPSFDPGSAIFDFSIIAKDVQGYVWRFPSLDDGNLACTRGIYNSRITPCKSKKKYQRYTNQRIVPRECGS